MAAICRALLVSTVATCSAGQDAPHQGVLNDILSFLKDVDLVKETASLLSAIGLPMTDTPLEKKEKHMKRRKVKKIAQVESGFASWREMHRCHEQCKPWDEVCHSNCPRPWDAIEATCQEVRTIKSCHQACGHDFLCHKQCPMPGCAHNQRRILAALHCHGQCVAVHGGRPCHASCPKPMKLISEKCERFETVRSCHMACGKGNPTCHQSCKASSPFPNTASGNHGSKLGNHPKFMERRDDADFQHVEVEHAVTVAMSFELDVEV